MGVSRGDQSVFLSQFRRGFLKLLVFFLLVGGMLACGDGNSVETVEDTTNQESGIQTLSQCLNFPACRNSTACTRFLDGCEDLRTQLEESGYDFICEIPEGAESGRCVSSPKPGFLPTECQRSEGWEVCPVTHNRAVNGRGPECFQNSECHQLNRNYYSIPENLNLNDLECIQGCCALDEDKDGLHDPGSNNVDLSDKKIQGPEDNCVMVANSDQDDQDLDCVGDACDNCPGVANPQVDSDNDGLGDACDNCPHTPNQDQKDSDGDGLGDACIEDLDGDGFPNDQDNCPNHPNEYQEDNDGDGVGNFCDNCFLAPNPDQAILPGRERGNACLCDWEGDGWLDPFLVDETCYDLVGPDTKFDNCPGDPNPGQEDGDLDTIGDACDYCPNDYDTGNNLIACTQQRFDFDGDGILNAFDNCPTAWNMGQEPLDPPVPIYECYPETGCVWLDVDTIQVLQACDSEGNNCQDVVSPFGAACDWCNALIAIGMYEYDPDQDGVDDCDNCPENKNPDQADKDGDLIGDACDNCPCLSNYGQKDLNENGIGDDCEDTYKPGDDCAGTVCGDGKQQVGETCGEPGLECNTNEICNLAICVCQNAGCGDGKIDENEFCGEPGLACKADEICNLSNCSCGPIPPCGNSKPDEGEVCDDGNLVDADGCDSNCTPTGCGNGITTEGEQCDDGNLINDDGCDSNCTPTGCGNDIINADETCGEPGLDSCPDSFSCNPESCACDPIPPCGNSKPDEGEVCDDGNLVDADGCDSNCTPTGCGNGITTEGEQCDDGNLINDDGCDSNCTPTGCGNEVINTGEQCGEPGLPLCDEAAGYYCSSCICQPPNLCGNGTLDPGEFCDSSAADDPCKLEGTLCISCIICKGSK